MTSGLAILMIGFFLGMRHATDPDHVIAVSTIVTRERSVARAGLIGILWGCGHTLTIAAVGAAIIFLGVAIPQRVGLTMEFSVGLMLILLGVLNLTGATRWISEKFSPAHPRVSGDHVHLHQHEGKLHFHWHSHSSVEDHHTESLAAPHWLRRFFEQLGLFPTLRPLLIGIVHGLAGSAAIALLVLSTIREPRWAVLYLLIFGLGTIAGMMLITAALALPFSFVGNKSARFQSLLVVSSGLISLGFGLLVCYRIGFVEGLFTTHPHWIPN